MSNMDMFHTHKSFISFTQKRKGRVKRTKSVDAQFSNSAGMYSAQTGTHSSVEYTLQ